MSGNSLKGYNNIRLTLLGPGGPGGVLQGGPLRRGFRPRGDGLDGPRLFGRQSLQTDVPLLKHLLDVLQALQCLQDVGLQEHSSPSTPRPSPLLQTARVCVRHTLMSSDRTTSYWLWRFFSSVSWFFSADSRKRSMSVSADSAPSCD